MTQESNAAEARRTPTYRRSAGLVVVVAAAIGLAACGGGATDPPHVATLGANSSNSKSAPSTTQPTGNPTQLLDQWATCIRGHGDPNQSDPTIDANKDIEITMHNASAALSSEVHGSTGPCSNYLLAAETALRGGQPAPQAPSAAQEAAYVDCMRANGVPNYPDPSANGDTDFEGTGVDPNSPTVENADKVCSKKTGIPYDAPGTEAPGVVQVRDFNGPTGGGAPPSGGAGANGEAGATRVPAAHA
jgi:hypothetical protein